MAKTHLFVQQIFLEYLLWIRLYTKYWENLENQSSHKPISPCEDFWTHPKPFFCDFHRMKKLFCFPYVIKDKIIKDRNYPQKSLGLKYSKLGPRKCNYHSQNYCLKVKFKKKLKLSLRDFTLTLEETFKYSLLQFVYHVCFKILSFRFLVHIKCNIRSHFLRWYPSGWSRNSVKKEKNGWRKNKYFIHRIPQKAMHSGCFLNDRFPYMYYVCLPLVLSACMCKHTHSQIHMSHHIFIFLIQEDAPIKPFGSCHYGA